MCLENKATAYLFCYACGYILPRQIHLSLEELELDDANERSTWRENNSEKSPSRYLKLRRFSWSWNSFQLTESILTAEKILSLLGNKKEKEKHILRWHIPENVGRWCLGIVGSFDVTGPHPTCRRTFKLSTKAPLITNWFWVGWIGAHLIFTKKFRWRC